MIKILDISSKFNSVSSNLITSIKTGNSFDWLGSKNVSQTNRGFYSIFPMFISTGKAPLEPKF